MEHIVIVNDCLSDNCKWCLPYKDYKWRLWNHYWWLKSEAPNCGITFTIVMMIVICLYYRELEYWSHRYLRKVDCSSFVMCPLLVLALPGVFLLRPLTVPTRHKGRWYVPLSSLFFNTMSMVGPRQTLHKSTIRVVALQRQAN